MSTPSIASNAYQTAAQLMRQAAGQPETKAATPDFGAMVEDAVQGVVEKGRDMDVKTVGLMEGKTDVVDVVTAIAETETALETMVTVRDKVIAAYEEIMRMQI